MNEEKLKRDIQEMINAGVPDNKIKEFVKKNRELNTYITEANKPDNLFFGENSLISHITEGVSNTYNNMLNLQTRGRPEEANLLDKFNAASVGLIGGIPAGLGYGLLETADDLTGEVVSDALQPALQSELAQNIGSIISDWNQKSHGGLAIAADMLGTGAVVSGAAKAGLKGAIEGLGVPARAIKEAPSKINNLYSSTKDIFGKKGVSTISPDKINEVTQSKELGIGSLTPKQKEAAIKIPNEWANEILDAEQNIDLSLDNKNPLDISVEKAKEVLNKFEDIKRQKGKEIGKAKERLKNTKINEPARQKLKNLVNDFEQELDDAGLVKTETGWKVVSDEPTKYVRDEKTINEINNIIKSIQNSTTLDRLNRGLEHLDNAIINWDAPGELTKGVQGLAENIRRQLKDIRDLHLTDNELKNYVEFSDLANFAKNFRGISARNQDNALKILLRRQGSLLDGELRDASKKLEELGLPRLDALGEFLTSTIKASGNKNLKTLFSQKIGDEIANAILTKGGSLPIAAVKGLGNIATAPFRKDILKELRKWGNVSVEQTKKTKKPKPKKQVKYEDLPKEKQKEIKEKVLEVKKLEKEKKVYEKKLKEKEKTLKNLETKKQTEVVKRAIKKVKQTVKELKKKIKEIIDKIKSHITDLDNQGGYINFQAIADDIDKAMKKDNIISEIKKAKSNGKSFDTFFKRETAPTMYHGGSKTDFDILDPNFKLEKAKKGQVDQASVTAEGPGVYFTNSLKEAQQYGDKIDVRTYLPTNTRIVNDYDRVFTKDEIANIVNKIPKEDLEIPISNWSENYNEGLKDLIKSITDTADTPTDQLMNIWAEVYQSSNSKGFLKLMNDVGIDGIELSDIAANRQGANTWTIIYNKDKFKTKSQLKELWDKIK